MAARDDTQKTALHLACSTGSTTVVQWLLDKGFDVKDEDGETRTPLHLACSKGNLPISQLLLKKGAKINAWDCSKTTPLHDACESENVDLVQYLIRSGSDVNAKDNYGVTPFLTACMKGNLELMTVLADAGVDISYGHYLLGKTSIQLALATGKEGIEEWFWKRDTRVKREDLTEALLVACDRADLEAAKMLIAKGADVNGSHGQKTVLTSACTKNNVALIRLLLEKGADVNKDLGCFEFDANSPLTTACMYGHVDLLPVLLQAGANINHENYYKQTPLHLAVCHRKPQVVKWLVQQKGIALNVRDKDGRTPLDLANGTLALALIRAGADINAGRLGGWNLLLPD